MNLEKLKKFQHWAGLNEYICKFIISVRTKAEIVKTMSHLRSEVCCQVFFLIAVNCHYCLKEISVPMKQTYYSMEKALYDFYSLVSYEKTHSFAALTRSFTDTIQLVNKNRTRTFSMK